MEIKVKKQMRDSTFSRSVVTFTSGAKVAMQSSIVATVALNLVFQGALS
jgi:hypothetical protein